MEPTPENARRVSAALSAFGAPLDKTRVDDFAGHDLVFQNGVAPLRVDVMTSISGVSFSDAWAGRQTAKYGDVPVNVIGKEALIANKRAIGRAQDMADVEALTRGQRG